jgi:MarR family transcriptional regulator, organic hydroperoxide resistance regulator
VAEQDLNRSVIAFARAHRAAAAQLLAEVGLHPGQEVLVLTLVERGPTSVSQLAGLLGVEVPTVTKMVRRVEAVGLVERRPDPADGRVVLVALTPAGEALRPELDERWARLGDWVVDDLSEEERTTLRELLDRAAGSLHRHMGAPDAPTC